MTGVQTALLLDAPEPVTARHRQRRAERDRAVDMQQHGKHRETVALAVKVACELIALHGSTCSPRVRAEMERRGLIPKDADRRFMGGALHPSRGFRVTGEWVPEGSKGQRVPMWRMA
jgi:hypothetical protein